MHRDDWVNESHASQESHARQYADPHACVAFLACVACVAFLNPAKGVTAELAVLSTAESCLEGSEGLTFWCRRVRDGGKRAAVILRFLGVRAACNCSVTP